MSRRSAIAALMLAIVLPAAATTQDQAPAGTPSRANLRVEYIRLLKEYIKGDADQAIADLSRLPPGATHSISTIRGKQWETEVRTPQRSFTLAPAASEGFPLLHELQLSLAAVMIETEAGFLSHRGDVLVDRLANAEIWLKSLAKPFPQAMWGEFRRRWSLAVGRRVLWSAVLGPADRILRDACELFPDDALLQVAYGHARETTAYGAGATTPIDRSAAAYARRQAFFDARNALERALRLDAESTESIEARVRLAHVNVRLGDDRRAAPLLEQTLSRNAPASYKYLAAVMLADIEARAGRVERALGMYLGARNVVPGAPNTYIAHAHTLRVAGRAGEAVDVLNEMLERPERTEDPWVQYPKGFNPDITRLEPLRAYVRHMKVQ